MTADEVIAGFTADIQAVLDKWKADVDLDVHGDAWAEISVSVDGVYDENGEIIRPFTMFNLGSSLSQSKP